MSFHKLDRAKDKHSWSVRENSLIRLIVHRTQRSLLLCYADHHDKAYDWAEQRLPLIRFLRHVWQRSGERGGHCQHLPSQAEATRHQAFTVATKGAKPTFNTGEAAQKWPGQLF